jgi:hypothetical protein
MFTVIIMRLGVIGMKNKLVTTLALISGLWVSTGFAEANMTNTFVVPANSYEYLNLKSLTDGAVYHLFCNIQNTQVGSFIFSINRGYFILPTLNSKRMVTNGYNTAQVELKEIATYQLEIGRLVAQNRTPLLFNDSIMFTNNTFGEMKITCLSALVT